MRTALTSATPKYGNFGLFPFGTSSAIEELKNLAQGIWLLRN